MIFYENPTIIIYAIVGFFVLVWYFVLTKIALRGVIQIQKQADQTFHSANLPRLSVIIAFRNEAENLPRLANLLLKQKYPKEKFEIILVNDHSEDDWEYALLKIKGQYKIINAKETGKKAALKEGIVSANGEYVVTTDADCIVSEGWLNSIGSELIEKGNDMIIGPVSIQQGDGFLNFFQQYDFIALQLFGLGYAKVNNPVMCNGANLIYSKKSFLEIGGKMKDSFTSGDDVFLMHEFKKAGFKIGTIISPSSIVYTKPENTWQNVFIQHMRWGSKAKGYSDNMTLILALGVMCINLFVVSTLILSFFEFQFLYLYLPIFILKGLTDRYLLRKGIVLFNLRWKELKYWMMQFIHPSFIVSVVILSFFIPVQWKGRKVKS